MGTDKDKFLAMMSRAGIGVSIDNFPDGWTHVFLDLSEVNVTFKPDGSLDGISNERYFGGHP